jgi:predicted NUDIX family phosphoesterase
MSKEDEMILCIKNPGFDGVLREKLDLDEIEGDTGFYRRGDVENDPSLRQIIPYLIIRDCKGHVLTYKRGEGGGEDRLHNLYSYGIGGHVNVSDADGDPESAMEIVFNCIERELDEELGLSAEDDLSNAKMTGVISLNESMVDKVHLGLVCVLDIKEGSLSKLNAEEGVCTAVSFKSFDELKELNLENWSRAFLPELKGLI